MWFGKHHHFLALGQAIILRCLGAGTERRAVCCWFLPSGRQAGLMSCASRMHPGNDAQTLRGLFWWNLEATACWGPPPLPQTWPRDGKGLGLGAGTPYPEEDRRGGWKEGGGMREAVLFVFSSPYAHAHIHTHTRDTCTHTGSQHRSWGAGVHASLQLTVSQWLPCLGLSELDCPV